MAYDFLDELVKKIGFNKTPTPQPTPKQSIVQKATGITNEPDFLSTLSKKVIERPQIQEDDLISKLSKNLTTAGIPKPPTITPSQPKNVIKPTFGDVIQAPSYLLGKGIIEPSYNFLSSSVELATGKELPKLNIPVIGDTKFFGDKGLVDASSYQQKYREQIDAGVPEKDAYKNVLIGGIFDAVNIAFPVKGGIRTGLIKYAPEKLITKEIETVSKQQLYDYLSGRKTASQLGIKPEVQDVITSKMQNMNTREKVEFLQGFDLIKSKPSTIGKMFGITEDEAKQLVGETVRQTSEGALPGYREVPGQAPAMGLSLKKIEPVGFEVSTALKTAAQDQFGKAFTDLSKSEMKKVFEKNPDEIITSNNLDVATKQVATPSYNKDIFERKPELLYGGLNEGVFTDSYQMILDKPISEKILTDMIEKEKVNMIKNMTKNGITYSEATAIADQKISEAKINNNQFPDYKSIIPDITKATPAEFVGINYNKINGPTLVFKNGERYIEFDSGYVANMKKYLPGAEIKIGPSKFGSQIMEFVEDGKIKGLLMPLNADEVKLNQKFKGVEPVPMDLPKIGDTIGTDTVEEVFKNKAGTWSITTVSKGGTRSTGPWSDMKPEQPITQKEQVKKAVASGEKTIKQIAPEPTPKVEPVTPTPPPVKPPVPPKTQEPTPESPEQKVRKYIISGKASEKIAQDIKNELYGVYDKKTNDALVQRAADRVNASIQDATDFALSEVSDEAVATGSVIMEYYSKLIEESTDPIFKKQAAEAAAKLFNKQAAQLTDAGRTIQAASLIGKKTPEGMLRTISKMIADYNKKRPVKNRLPQISGDDVIKIIEKGKEIEKMPDGLKKEVKIKEMTDYLEQLIPTPWWKKVVYVYKAGMLTGIGTHGLNIASTFFNTVFEEIKNVPATGIDIIASKFTGERTKSLVNPLEYFKGGAEGAIKGYNYLKTGVSGEAGETSLEHYKVHFNSKLGKALEKYANSVYRFLGATDSVFYYGAYKRSLVEQAKISYINNKITTDKTKYIEDFINNPTDKALELANLDAQIATFKNDTTLGQIAQYIQNRPFIGPVAQMTILPFAKTPSAVAMAMFNYTPAGAVRTFYKSFKHGNFDQKEFADGLGRIVTGFGALWLGYKLFLDDKITLGYPKDEKERALWEATGKTPYSIKFGNKWVPLVTFGPQGMVLGIGGHFANGYKETGSVAGGILSGFTGGGSSLTEQTFLTGVKTLIDAINEPGKSGVNWAGNTIASIIPSIVNNFVKASDEYQRKSSGTILGPIKARIPGLRQTLPVKLDVWGQPLERNMSGVYTAIGPIRMSNTIEGKLNTEVERLGKLGEDVRPTKVDRTINKIKLEDDEYQAYQKFNGELTRKVLETVISSNDYQMADPETQGKIFTMLVSEVRNQTRDMFIGPTLQRRYNLPNTDPAVLVELVKQLENNNDNGRFKKQTLEKQESIVKAVLKDIGM